MTIYNELWHNQLKYTVHAKHCGQGLRDTCLGSPVKCMEIILGWAYGEKWSNVDWAMKMEVVGVLIIIDEFA